VAWVLDTAINAVRSANRVVMCKAKLLEGAKTFLLRAFQAMAALRRAVWVAPTLVPPEPPSILPADFRGADKLASDLAYALDVGRRFDMCGSGTSLSPPSLAVSTSPLPIAWCLACSGSLPGGSESVQD
jgi:hypothetical protein